MKYKHASAIVAALIVFCCLIHTQPPKMAGSKISIDVSTPGAKIPSSMYSNFFEEINHSGEGGSYAELIQTNSGRIKPTGRITALSGEKEMDENTFDQPLRITPKQERIVVLHRSLKWNVNPIL